MFPETAGTIQRKRQPKQDTHKKLKPSPLFQRVKAKLREIVAFIFLVVSIWLFTGVAIFLTFNFFEKDINEQFIRKYSADDKVCLIKTKKHELSGTRTYSYTYIDLLGYRIRRNTNVEETTRINIDGYAITVAGMNADNSLPVRLSIDSGERYSQLLNRADTYIFTLGEGKSKEIVSVNYDKLCK